MTFARVLQGFGQFPEFLLGKNSEGLQGFWGSESLQRFLFGFGKV